MRAAAIGFGDPGYSEDLARTRHGQAVAQVRRSVADLVDVGLHCDERLSLPAVERLVKEHAEKPFDALFLMQVSWARPAVLLQVLRALPHLPMILYSPGGTTEQGVIRSIAPAAGMGSTLPILRSSGIKYKYVWSVPDMPIEEAAFMPFLRAAAAVNKIRGTKLGMIGFGDMRLQATSFDVQNLHQTFGIEVESLDMLELRKEMDAIEPRVLAEQTRELTASWSYHDNKTPSGESLDKVIAAYLVLDRWAVDRSWIGVSIKCPTGVSAHLGFTPCMVGNLLARKYHYICENDVPGLLTQVILGSLSGSMSTYWELYEILGKGILLGCCGFCPESFLEEPMKVRVIEEFFSGLGCCGQPKMGAYTLGRLGKNPRGEYLFHCVEGETAPPPAWCEVAIGPPQHPSVTFLPDGSTAEMLERVLAQHFSVVSGRWRSAVEEFARLLDIPLI
ncbi:MAG: hypothetical protein IT426_04590 [Pirellulales bacterium]|nr:hypothetical protein [Pirellulales bacterium]